MSVNNVVRITIIGLNMVISYGIVVFVLEAVVMMRMGRLRVAPVMEQEKNDTRQNLTQKKARLTMSFKACIAVGLMCFSGLALADSSAYIKCDPSARYVPIIEMVVEEVIVNSHGTVVSYIDNNGKHYSLVGYTCFIDHDYNHQPNTESKK